MWIVVALLLIVGFFVAAAAVVVITINRWGMQWGATASERAAVMTGDRCTAGGPSTRVVMTRAISIDAPPDAVWPWLAQLGRGAGWYSFDRLDNGGKTSARHILSWVPEPHVGDSSAIGYLCHIDTGHELVWWSNGEHTLGSVARMSFDIHLTADGTGSRLVARVSGDAAGPTARLLLWLFPTIDSIMARRQLLGIKKRVEAFGARSENPDEPETGARDQFQLYEVIYASGERAGVSGKEHAPFWRQKAIEDGVLPPG